MPHSFSVCSLACLQIVRLWQQGLIVPPAPGASHPLPPDRPARDPSKVRGGEGAGAGRQLTGQWLPSRPALRSSSQVKLVDAKDVPKRGRGGSLQSRQALLHALTHIENAAVDLAW